MNEKTGKSITLRETKDGNLIVMVANILGTYDDIFCTKLY